MNVPVTVDISGSYMWICLAERHLSLVYEMAPLLVPNQNNLSLWTELRLRGESVICQKYEICQTR